MTDSTPATAAQLAEQSQEIALLRALVKAHEAGNAAALYSAKLDLLEWDEVAGITTEPARSVRRD